MLSMDVHIQYMEKILALPYRHTPVHRDILVCHIHPHCHQIFYTDFCKTLKNKLLPILMWFVQVMLSIIMDCHASPIISLYMAKLPQGQQSCKLSETRVSP